MADFERGKWPYLPTRAKSKTVAGNSPSSTNKMVACLKNVFDLAVKAHVIAKNPAEELSYKPPKKAAESAEIRRWQRIIYHIRTKAGHGRMAGDLVEGLSCSDLRFNPKSGMGIGYLPQPAGHLIVLSPASLHF